MQITRLTYNKSHIVTKTQGITNIKNLIISSFKKETMDKRIIIFVISLIFSNILLSQSNFKVLCVLPDKLGTNYNLNIDLFEYFGWDVTTTGTTSIVNTCIWSSPMGNISIEVDTLISDIQNTDYWDLIAIMPMQWWSGNAYGDLINNAHFLNLLQQANQQDKLIWATCAGVRVLAYADIIDGVNVTGKDYFTSEYIAAGANYLGADILPVVDGNIITSTRGLYYYYQNISAIINAQSLISKEAGKNHINRSDTLSAGYRQIAITNNNEYIYCGYQYFGEKDCDIFITKCNDSGDEIWSVFWNNSNWDYATDITSTEEGNILVTGFTTQNNQQQDLVVLKYNSDGQLQWQKFIGGAKPDVGKSILKASNGNIYVCGHTESTGNGEDDILLVCLSTDGDLLWQQTFGGSASELGTDIIESHDGHLLILGNTGSFGAGNRDVLLIKANLNGNLIWSRTFGNEDYQSANSLIETPDKSILIVGETDILGDDLMDILLIKTDSLGNEIWNHHYDGFNNFYDFGSNISELSTENYLISGHSKEIEDRRNRGLIMFFNSNGEVVEKLEYGDDESNCFYSTIVSDNSTIYFCGHKKYQSYSSYSPWFSKINHPLTFVQLDSKTKNELLTAFPNPFQNNVTFSLNEADLSEFQISIVNIWGQCIWSKAIPKSDHTPLIWDGKDQNGHTIKPGVYIVQLIKKKQLIANKLLIKK